MGTREGLLRRPALSLPQDLVRGRADEEMPSEHRVICAQCLHRYHKLLHHQASCTMDKLREVDDVNIDSKMYRKKYTDRWESYVFRRPPQRRSWNFEPSAAGINCLTRTPIFWKHSRLLSPSGPDGQIRLAH